MHFVLDWSNERRFVSDLAIEILPQPDDVTCGPTSLHAVYRHFGLDLDLHGLIAEINALDGGGTLGVYLGQDALERGFEAELYTYDLEFFDPTWAGLDGEVLVSKLEAQLQAKGGDRHFVQGTRAFQRFLRLGGHIRFEEPSTGLMARSFRRDRPVLAGLSATYLYGSMREYTGPDRRSVFDDVQGRPVGHFVVLCGIEHGKVLVADPFRENPLSDDHYYHVDAERLVRAILLGIVTYDANMLVIGPRESPG
jgi:hypothetical protein